MWRNWITFTFLPVSCYFSLENTKALSSAIVLKYIPEKNYIVYTFCPSSHWEFSLLKGNINFHLIFSIISVKAKSFADREIRYTLKAKGQGAGTFNIGPTSGIVKLAKELDFEDVRQPHIYQLVITATEDSGGFSTSVDVSKSVIVGRFCVSMR